MLNKSKTIKITNLYFMHGVYLTITFRPLMQMLDCVQISSTFSINVTGISFELITVALKMH